MLKLINRYLDWRARNARYCANAALQYQGGWVGLAVSGISAISGLMGDNASQTAAGQQSAAAQMGIDEINKIGDRTRSDTQPYRALGAGTTNKLSYLLGVGGSADGSSAGSNGQNYTLKDFVDFGNYWKKKNGANATAQELLDNAKQQYQDYTSGTYGTDQQTRDYFGGGFRNPVASTTNTNDPSYGSLMKAPTLQEILNDPVYQNGLKFGLDTGTNAINTRSLASGSNDSGATLKALVQYGNDYATTKTGDAYNRGVNQKDDNYRMLMGGTGVGQNAVNTDASTGANLAAALSGQYNAQGNAQSAGTIGSANSWSNAISGIGNSIGGIFNPASGRSSGIGTYGDGGGTSPGINFTGYKNPLSNLSWS